MIPLYSCVCFWGCLTSHILTEPSLDAVKREFGSVGLKWTSTKFWLWAMKVEIFSRVVDEVRWIELFDNPAASFLVSQWQSKCKMYSFSSPTAFRAEQWYGFWYNRLSSFRLHTSPSLILLNSSTISGTNLMNCFCHSDYMICIKTVTLPSNFSCLTAIVEAPKGWRMYKERFSQMFMRI